MVSYALCVFAHYSGINRLIAYIRGPSLSIVMFHRIRDEFDPLPLSIRPSTFKKLVQLLDSRNKLTPLEAGLEALNNGPRTTCYTLTFDDGYRDNLELLSTPGAKNNTLVYISTGLIGGQPIWVYKLITAVFNSTVNKLDLSHLNWGIWDCQSQQQKTDFISFINGNVKGLEVEEINTRINIIVGLTGYDGAFEGDQMLCWPDVDKLLEAGIEIGSHTVNHEILTNTSHQACLTELSLSARHICDNTSKNEVLHFAYPNGTIEDFSAETEENVKSAGYATAVTTIEGLNAKNTSPYKLKRFNIDENRCLNPWGKFSPARFYGETGGILTFLKALKTEKP